MLHTPVHQGVGRMYGVVCLRNFTPSPLFYKEVGKSIKFSKWFFKENKILGKNNMILVK